MRYEFFIGLRYLISKKKSTFVTFISFLSAVGIAIGVMALIVVIAVMAGFSSELKDKIIGANAHIIIESEYGLSDIDNLRKKVEAVEHVVSTSPYIKGQVMAGTQRQMQPVILRGIDYETEARVTSIREYLSDGVFPDNSDQIVVGSQLAKILRVDIGDSLKVVSPIDGAIYEFQVCGLFTSGMYDYDVSMAFIKLDKAAEVFRTADKVNGLGVRVDNIYQADKIKKDLEKVLGQGYWVRSWIDVNQNFLSVLKLEKTVMFLILSLIILVACFNICSSLIMIVKDKTRDIGVLKSLGANRLGIMTIFTLDGFLIGLIGTAIGGVLGFLLIYVLKTYNCFKIPGEFYFIDRLPVKVELWDSAIIIAAALVISFLATLYPAWKASRLEAVKALRYE